MTNPAEGGVPVATGMPVTARDRVMAGLLAGQSLKRMSKQLGLARSTVQQHRDRLLSDGCLVKVEGRYFPGASRGGAGAGHHTNHAPVPPTHHATTGTPPARIDVATDGKRTFKLTRAPIQVDLLPGFVKSKPKGRKPVSQLLHLVHHRSNGRTWNLWLEQGLKTGVWSLWVGRVDPPVPMADFQMPGEEPDAAWDRHTVHTVVEWAARASVALEPVPRRSRPLSVAYPGVVQGGTWRSPASDADQTPPDPSGRLALEVRGLALQDFVNNGPEWKAAMLAALHDQREILEAAVRVNAVTVEAVIGLTKRGAATPVSPLTLPSPDSRSDVA